ncbi:MAG: hypothetical protein KA801_17610 [Syntrophorhabdaceae bacterium]|nr:hypothetical protein [Syntrophorhabdaceae bacterium]
MRPVIPVSVAVAVCLLVTGSISPARDLGTFGATYPIVEKDALKEIEQKAGRVDVSKIINKKRLIDRVDNFRPSDMAELRKIGPARKESAFLVDMTYSLQFDIPDGQGGVLYPRDYVFNPLDYVVYPNTLVFLNGRNPKQVVWFRTSEYARDYRVKLIITDGSYLDLSRALRRPVFYASKALVNIFRIRAVPSVVKQKGNKMEVREIAVGEKTIR